MSQNKIPYFIQYEENASITTTDIIYFDNGSDIAQAITFNDFVSTISTTTTPTDYKPHFLLMGC